MVVKKIYGSPGTGKTWTLINEFAGALRTTRPERVALLAFTRAARLEAFERAGRPATELPWLRTVHSACFRALSATRDQVVTALDVKKFGKAHGIELTGTVRDPWFNDATGDREWGRATSDDQIIQAWHLARHRGVKLSQVLPATVQTHYAEWVVEAYETWKANEGMLDYTDLLVEFLRSGRVPELDHVFVDEAQDLSWLQWQVVKRFARDARSLTVAGDDDQAIFNWAGARAELLTSLPSDEEVILPVSRRLPRQVLRLASQVIARVKARVVKNYEPRDADGSVRLGVSDVTAQALEGQTLVLFRNNHRALALAARLEELGVLFDGAGSPLVARSVRAALEAWAELSAGRLVDRERARALVDLTGPEWLSTSARQLLRDARDRRYFNFSELMLRQPREDEWPRALVRVPRAAQLERAFRRAGGKLSALLSPRVRLLSIHQAKGMEADTVIVDSSMARRSFESLYGADADDEHRVWYVAATRARVQLVVLTGESGQCYPF